MQHYPPQDDEGQIRQMQILEMSLDLRQPIELFKEWLAVATQCPPPVHMSHLLLLLQG